MLDDPRVGPHPGSRHRDLDDVAHERRVRFTQATAFHQELVELASERPGLDADLADRPVEDRANESGRDCSRRARGAGSSRRPAGHRRGPRAGPERHAQKIRIPADLLTKRVGPGEPGWLPLAPGRIRRRPPADSGAALVERRRRERAGDARCRRRARAPSALPRRRLSASRPARARATAAGAAGRPRAGRARRRSRACRPKTRATAVSSCAQRSSVNVSRSTVRIKRFSNGTMMVQHLLRGQAPPVGAGARERQAKLGGLGLALEEGRKRRIVEVNDAEDAGQHAVGSLHGRLEACELFLACGRHLRARRRLAQGGRVPGDLEDPLGLREALQLVEPEIDVLDGSSVGSPQLDAARRRSASTRRRGSGRARRRRRCAPPGSRCRRCSRRPPGESARPVLMPMPMAMRGPDWSRLRLGDDALDGDGAEDGAAGGAEGDHEAVALGLDDDAAVRLDLASDDRVLLAHDLRGASSPELLGIVGESSDIAEKDGDGAAERHRGFGCGPGIASFALRVFVHLAAASGGTKNSSRCVEKTRAPFQPGAPVHGASAHHRRYLRTTRRALSS